MADGNDHWWRALEEQLQEQTIGVGYALVGRLYDFGQLDKLIVLKAIVPTLELPVLHGMTKRYGFTGRCTDGHMSLEGWVKATGTFPPHVCGTGMVDVSFADYELTGGTI